MVLNMHIRKGKFFKSVIWVVFFFKEKHKKEKLTSKNGKYWQDHKSYTIKKINKAKYSLSEMKEAKSLQTLDKLK